MQLILCTSEKSSVNVVVSSYALVLMFSVDFLKKYPIALPRVFVATQGDTYFIWVRYNPDLIKYVRDLRGG
jgi:hypothetical protein